MRYLQQIVGCGSSRKHHDSWEWHHPKGVWHHQKYGCSCAKKRHLKVLVCWQFHTSRWCWAVKCVGPINYTSKGACKVSNFSISSRSDTGTTFIVHGGANHFWSKIFTYLVHGLGEKCRLREQNYPFLQVVLWKHAILQFYCSSGDIEKFRDADILRPTVDCGVDK